MLPQEKFLNLDPLRFLLTQSGQDCLIPVTKQY